MSDDAERAFQRKMLTVDDRPLQRGNEPHRRVEVKRVGGPGTGADVRLFLSVLQLEEYLAMARSSLTGRVVLHEAGMELVKYCDDSTGHTYQVLTLISRPPKPEMTMGDTPFGG